MWKLIKQVEKILQNYPYGSQSNAKDPIIVAKLMDTWSKITWWLSEYDPIDRVAFCYVTWFFYDEWGSVSLDELESLVSPLIDARTWQKIWEIPRVIVDENFEQTEFSKLNLKSNS